MEASKTIRKKEIDCSAVVQGVVQAFRAGQKVQVLPVWDKDRCIRCGVCYLYCPHGAIVRDADGYFDKDEQLCSGCGVCHRECWFGVIGMVEEVR